MNENVKVVFGLLGGLALFLYGMNSMSDALQKAAGEKMKKILEILTKNPIMGALAGALVTAVLQSSSATTVMVIGFVSAGLMTLPQGISVIFGANIGTTMTAQLMAFKISDYIYPLIFIGFIINFVCKQEKVKQVGRVIFSFGLLFEGIEIMGSVMKPLATSPIFIDLMGKVKDIPVLGVLLGCVMTLVVQSSSATIAVLQNFASQAGPDGVTSVIGLGGAIPILFGDNIGTTITALLASIGQSKNAKRTAVAHSVFNITGSIVFMFLIPVLSKFVRYISPKGNEVDVISRQIANAHTTFNIVCTLVWLPLIPVMVKIVKFIVRGDDAKEKAVFTAKYLDDKLINQPTAALYLVSEEIKRSASYAAEAFSYLKAAVTAKKDGVAGRKFNEYSEYVKVLQESISTYISKMFSSGNLTELQSEQTAGLLCVSNNIERIAERCDEIDRSYENLKSKGYKLSNEAINEVKECMELSGKLFEEAIEAVATGDDKVIDKMTRDKNKIRKKNRQCSKAHFGRVKNKKCSKAMSGDYTEILQNIGRITDNCVGIAEEAMDNVKFMTLNAEEMEQYGNVIDFSQAKQVEGTKA